MANKFILIFLVIFTSECFSQSAHQQLQIKGLKTGMSPTQACGSEKITSTFDDIVRELKPTMPKLVEMKDKQCEIKQASFAGVTVNTPARLLFIDDKLVYLKLEISDELPLEDYVTILKAISNEYGKPHRKKYYHINTDEWKLNGDTLLLEAVRHSWDKNEVAVTLQNDFNFSTYNKRFNLNKEIMDNSKVINDVR